MILKDGEDRKEAEDRLAMRFWGELGQESVKTGR